MSSELGFAAVVEGPSDEGAVRAIFRECGLPLRQFYGGRGRPDIQKKIGNYNRAAMNSDWFVLADLDDIHTCPAELAATWLPNPSPRMVLRFAVVELESWLMADFEAMADFLAIAPSKIPARPDELADPKQALVNLARRSRKKDIRSGLVPRDGSGAVVGRTYTSDIQQFGDSAWRPAIAAERSPSLARCLARLKRLTSGIDDAGLPPSRGAPTATPARSRRERSGRRVRAGGE
jgi:hypothetical protein